MKERVGLIVLSVGVISALFVQFASADRYTSSNYTIDASEVGNSFGGASSDADYKLTSSGGESVIGQGSGGSYQLDSGYVAQLQSSLQLSVQPASVEFYYPFDETSGTFVRDASQSDMNGNTIASPSWTSGKVNGALSLNGTSQYVTGKDIDVSMNLTVSAWVYPTSSQTSTIVSKHSSTSDAQALLELTSSVPDITMTIGGSAKTVADTGNALPSNTWSLLTATYDGSTLKLYVNGTLAGSTVASGAIATNAFTWTIGRDANASTHYFAGSVDEVKLLSRALSANEVKAEYNAGSAGNTAGLAFSTDVTPGVSETSDFDLAVLTDAPNGYTLALSQNQALTSGSDTIAPVSGSISSPLTWSEGTTKGFGFTLYGTNATAIDGKWGSGNAYAAFPGSATSFYARSGAQSAKDVINMRLRLDVPNTQPAGTYSNVITTTGTITP